jgi:hypothetical protein
MLNSTKPNTLSPQEEVIAPAEREEGRAGPRKVGPEPGSKEEKRRRRERLLKEGGQQGSRSSTYRATSRVEGRRDRRENRLRGGQLKGRRFRLSSSSDLPLSPSRLPLLLLSGSPSNSTPSSSPPVNHPMTDNSNSSHSSASTSVLRTPSPSSAFSSFTLQSALPLPSASTSTLNQDGVKLNGRQPALLHISLPPNTLLPPAATVFTSAVSILEHPSAGLRKELWKDDADADVCDREGCGAQFSLLKLQRKHHCRK